MILYWNIISFLCDIDRKKRQTLLRLLFVIHYFMSFFSVVLRDNSSKGSSYDTEHCILSSHTIRVATEQQWVVMGYGLIVVVVVFSFLFVCLSVRLFSTRKE